MEGRDGDDIVAEAEAPDKPRHIYKVPNKAVHTDRPSILPDVHAGHYRSPRQQRTVSMASDVKGASLLN